MQSKLTLKFSTLILIFIPFLGMALKKAPETDKKSEIKAYIQHHLQDSYDFSLFSYTNDDGAHIYIGAPLPVILWDDGLKVFSSSKFNHGETLAEVDGSFYKLYHNKIYKTNKQGAINYDDHNHPINVKPLDFSITKSVVMILITSLLMFYIFRALAR